MKSEVSPAHLSALSLFLKVTTVIISLKFLLEFIFMNMP